MALQSGKTQYAGSMAEAMEKAFKDQVAKGQPKSDEQMKVMFIAVAEGMIQHLAAHPDSFQITVKSSQNNDITYTAKVEAITSTNT